MNHDRKCAKSQPLEWYYGDTPTAEDIDSISCTCVSSTPLPEPLSEATGTWGERFYDKFSFIQAIKNEKSGNAYTRVADFIRSELARAVEEERKAWLQGIRCTECGEQNLNEMSNMCGKCLEEA